MKFKTDEEILELIYDYVLKEIQKWFVKKYFGRIFQSFTSEARKIPGVTPCSISFIEEDNVKIYRDYYNSKGMIIVIEITRRRTGLPLFYKSVVYYNNSSNSIIYNLCSVKSVISNYMDRMVISNDVD